MSRLSIDGSPGKNGARCFATPIGPTPGPPPPCGMQNVLCKIQMANVGAVIARAAKTDLRVHVRAIHINLAAVGVNDFANFANRRLENAVS